MTSQTRIDEFIEKWKPATKAELRDRLKTLKTKYKSDAVMAEIKAIQTLLA